MRHNASNMMMKIDFILKIKDFQGSNNLALVRWFFFMKWNARKIAKIKGNIVIITHE